MSGDTSRSIPIIFDDIFVYFLGFDDFLIRLGHLILASENLIPVLIPNALASYEQVIIHEPLLPFVTAIGLWD